jgi:CCR4-NOT transcription complex subunit 7/8
MSLADFSLFLPGSTNTNKLSSLKKNNKSSLLSMGSNTNQLSSLKNNNSPLLSMGSNTNNIKVNLKKIQFNFKQLIDTIINLIYEKKKLEDEIVVLKTNAQKQKNMLSAKKNSSELLKYIGVLDDYLIEVNKTLKNHPDEKAEILSKIKERINKNFEFSNKDYRKNTINNLNSSEIISDIIQQNNRSTKVNTISNILGPRNNRGAQVNTLAENIITPRNNRGAQVNIMANLSGRKNNNRNMKYAKTLEELMGVNFEPNNNVNQVNLNTNKSRNNIGLVRENLMLNRNSNNGASLEESLMLNNNRTRNNGRVVQENLMLNRNSNNGSSLEESLMLNGNSNNGASLEESLMLNNNNRNRNKNRNNGRIVQESLMLNGNSNNGASLEESLMLNNNRNRNRNNGSVVQENLMLNSSRNNGSMVQKRNNNVNETENVNVETSIFNQKNTNNGNNSNNGNNTGYNGNNNNNGFNNNNGNNNNTGYNSNNSNNGKVNLKKIFSNNQPQEEQKENNSSKSLLTSIGETLGFVTPNESSAAKNNINTITTNIKSECEGEDCDVFSNSNRLSKINSKLGNNFNNPKTRFKRARNTLNNLLGKEVNYTKKSRTGNIANIPQTGDAITYLEKT